MLGEAIRFRHRLTIQARIALLVVACIVPSALLATFVIYLTYDRERASIERHALDTTRGLLRVVESDLAASAAALQALATSPSIDAGDFAAFYRRAGDVLGYTSGFTIVLSDASGQQLVNLLRPDGAPLPRHGNPELQRRVLKSRQAVVSDMYIGAVTQEPLVGIEVPVIRGGKALYSLALGMDTKHLGELLRQQGIPKEWVVSIFDSAGTIVARSHAGDQFVGQKGSAPLLARMREVPEGVLDAPTLEGIPVMAAFSRSPAFGWTVATGVPVAIVTADLKKWLGLYAAGASLLLLAGLGMAVAMGRRIAGPIQALIAPSLAIGEGKPVAIPPLELMEAEAVGHALQQAQQLIHRREQERDRAEQAERQMLLAKQSAEQASAAKATYLANISHELRTPLNVILGFSQMLRDAPNLDAGQEQHLEIIVRSGERLLNLINNVLDISKIEAGHVALENARFDLHRLLHEVQSALHVRAAEKGLDFTMVLAPDLPKYVSADAGKLNQVLINLIANAIKFTNTGGVFLRADAVKREPPQRTWLRFEIEDSGPGISEQDRLRIFFPFVQLREQPPADAGTGLGLAISKQYVELMGGSIGVASESGKGSTFHFEVPVEIVARASEAAAGNTAQARVVGLAGGQQRFRLLIAEDQPENRMLLRYLLEPLGFEIREAANGQEAVAQFEQWQPHLIWMDIRMPVMNGLDATRRIRESAAGAKTRIVAVTAHSLDDEREEILAAGCDDFVRKPYRKAEIFAALEKHLGVQFTYAAGAAAAVAAAGGELYAERLQRLPPGLLLELREAAELLDGPRCIELAGRIEAGERELREWLQRMVMDLRYTELLEALDKAVAVRPA